MTEPGQRITISFRRDLCEIDDETVRDSLPVERWREWLPAFQAALDGVDPEVWPVRGKG